jgi:phage-related tail fiber protein
VAELLIPPETGGFWMREMGLYDDTGTLIAVGNMAESYKPALAEGSGRADRAYGHHGKRHRVGRADD